MEGRLSAEVERGVGGGKGRVLVQDLAPTTVPMDGLEVHSDGPGAKAVRYARILPHFHTGPTTAATG